MPASGRIDVRITNLGGTDYYVNSGSWLLTADQWVHLALVWDPSYVDQTWGNVGQITIYVDHVIRAQGLGDGDLGYVSGKFLAVGGRDNSGNGLPEVNFNGWPGDMDELRWTNAILDPSNFLPVPDPLIPASNMDFNCDEIVNFLDFARFAAEWLEEL